MQSFDPDATPEQKAAAAGKARSQLQAVPGAERLKQRAKDQGGRAVTIDTSSSTDAPKPTISMADIDSTSRAEGQEVGGDSIPGAVPTGAAPPVPQWMQTGWKQVAGAAAGGDEKTQLEAGILANYV